MSRLVVGYDISMRDRSISLLAFDVLLVGCPNTKVIVGASSSHVGSDTEIESLAMLDPNLDTGDSRDSI